MRTMRREEIPVIKEGGVKNLRKKGREKRERKKGDEDFLLISRKNIYRSAYLNLG